MPPPKKATAIKGSTSSQYLPPSNPTPTPDLSYESLKMLLINQETQIRMKNNTQEPFNPRTMIYPEISDFEIVKRFRNLKQTDTMSLEEYEEEFMKVWLRMQNIDFQLWMAYLFITGLRHEFQDEIYPFLSVIATATVNDAAAIAKMIEAKIQKSSRRKR